MRKERVLLCLVEPVDFVDEQQRAPAALGAIAIRRGDDFADFLDAGRHRAEGDEIRVDETGEQSGQRGLAGAGRAPEDHRVERPVLEREPQRAARPQQLILTDQVVERAGPHPFG